MATIIADYRRKYRISADEPQPLGPEPAAGAFRQRLDRRRAVRQALNARSKRDAPVQPQDLTRDLESVAEIRRERDEPTFDRDL